MTKKERFRRFVSYFEAHQPAPETELRYEDPFQLLVAVVLSAQCTDKRVNMCTPALFERFPTAAALATATFDDVFPYVQSISYPRNKTKHLLGTARMLVEQFDHTVPDNVEDLQKLPGVGRKTANVVASVIYQRPTMAVDTHVFRVSKRIGLATLTAKTPLEVEKQLLRHLQPAEIPHAHHWLILHGRYVCTARRPQCEACPLTDFCRYYQKQARTSA